MPQDLQTVQGSLTLCSQLSLANREKGVALGEVLEQTLGQATFLQGYWIVEEGQGARGRGRHWQESVGIKIMGTTFVSLAPLLQGHWVSVLCSP